MMISKPLVSLAVIAFFTMPVQQVLADPGGGDAADDAETATTLSVSAVPTTYMGTLTAGDQDWYRFAVAAVSTSGPSVLRTITVTMTPDCPGSQQWNFNVELYEGDGDTLIDDDPEGDCDPETVSCTANANQIVFVKIYSVSTIGASESPGYSFTVTVTPYPLLSPVVPDEFCTLGAL